ncbi:hypothetical protein IGI78_000842 [Enterococcus sp. DIV1767]|uniref:hypothetical protein n=1 Tax=Enterococcus sp. DIV1767 TaxID=2774670 RepID=UPI003D2FCA3E
MGNEENQISLLKVNIESNKIEIIETKKEENKVIFQVTDPLENKILLWNNTFQYHILGKDGSHEDRSYLSLPENFNRLKNVLKNPSYILQDKEHDDRLLYIKLMNLDFGKVSKIKPLAFVTEPSKKIENTFEVCTIMVRGKVSEEINEGRRLIYDVDQT